VKKRVLIFIENSLGELDWNAPFLMSNDAEQFEFDLFFNNVAQGVEEQLNILRSYGLESKVNLITADKVLTFLSRMCLALGKKTHPVFLTWAKALSVKAFGQQKKYDAIFRDYSLKRSFALDFFMEKSPDAKIVVYPHAVGLQRLSPNAAEKYSKVRDVKVDLWLENSHLSNRVLNQYAKQFFVSGAPGLAARYELNPLFDSSSKTVLIVTRHTYEVYGCSTNAALKRFEECLSWLHKNGFEVIIKHHPRQNRSWKYRKIQRKFSNVKEFEGSLNYFNQPLVCCLSFFSTAGLFLSARKVPVFDITPYRACSHEKVKGLAVHYCLNNRLTHALIEFGMQSHLDSLELLKDVAFLETESQKQFRALSSHFPANSSQLIAKKLQEILM
jgi:hypothetical protein